MCFIRALIRSLSLIFSLSGLICTAGALDCPAWTKLIESNLNTHYEFDKEHLVMGKYGYSLRLYLPPISVFVLLVCLFIYLSQQTALSGYFLASLSLYKFFTLSFRQFYSTLVSCS